MRGKIGREDCWSGEYDGGEWLVVGRYGTGDVGSSGCCVGCKGVGGSRG